MVRTRQQALEEVGGRQTKRPSVVQINPDLDLVISPPVRPMNSFTVADAPPAPTAQDVADYRMSFERGVKIGRAFDEYGRVRRNVRRKKKRKRKATVRKAAAAPRATFTSGGQLTADIGGHGGYFTDKLRDFGRGAVSYLKQNVPAGTFAGAGRAFGNQWGGPAGMLGGAAGQGIANAVGFGAYRVSQNSLMAKIDEGVQIPQFANCNHATIMTHREYIQDITAVGATAFTNLSFPMNPGLNEIFPFLGLVAQNFDQYQILGMIWEFRTMSSDITAGGALGSVVMATDYDAVDANYSSKQEMENSEYATSNKPSVDTVHCIECDPAVTFSPIKYIRTGGIPSGKDPRLYDHGNFQLATVGLPTSGATVIGELWCSYEIALYKPNLANSNNGGFMDHFVLSTSVSSAHYLGADTVTVYKPTSGSTIQGSIVNSTYTWPASIGMGNYMVTYVVVGAATTLSSPMVLTPTNASNLGLVVNNSINYIRVTANSTLDTEQIAVFFLTITSVGASFVLGNGTLPGSVSSADLYVSAIPIGIN